MAFIGEWLRRLGYLLRRRAWEDELREEIEAHRAQMQDPSAFGNTLLLREEAREAWGWRWLDALIQDIRVAARMLRRSPGFALTAIATLALGIGVNSGMFSLLNGLLLRPLYAGVDDVVEVHGRRAKPLQVRDFSYPNYRDLQEGTTSVFASLAAFSTGFAGVDDGRRPRRALASAVTASYFDVFDGPLASGRSFTTEEERPGAGIHVAVISYPLWEQLGGDPRTPGRQIRINGEPFTVIGVAREGFAGMSIPGPEVWIPLGASAIFNAPDAPARLTARDAHELNVVGRLRQGISAQTARSALAAVGRRLEQAFPSINAGYSVVMSTPDRTILFLPDGAGAAVGLVLLLMLMPAIVLLVACLNLADLLLARGHGRRRELAIRSSLGVGRFRLIRQLLTEGLILALAGGAIGMWLSTWATSTLMAWLRSMLPVAVTLPDVSLDWRVLLGTAAFSVVATLIFGIGPALTLTRRAAASDLRRHTDIDGHRPAGVRIGSALVVGQIALSLLLLASGGLFLMSARSAASADPGFRLDGGVIVQVDPALAGYDETRGRQAHLALVDRLRTVPGIDAVTIGSRPPFTSAGDSREVAPAGAAAASSGSVDAVFSIIGRDYASVLGLPLRGRDFSEAELMPGSADQVAIIDDLLADELWPGEEALGRQIQFRAAEGSDGRQLIRVIGVIPAVKHSLGNPRPSPHVYVPLGQRYESAMTLQLRVADGIDERVVLATIARVVGDVDERMPVLSVATWRDHLASGLDATILRAGAGVFSTFGGMALLLAVVGVYGVKSHVVARRTRELGIRLAIGARPRALLWQVLREGGRATAIGVGIGLVLAAAAGKFLQSRLYGLNAIEPVVLVSSSLILLAASLLASAIPAWRAARVDPVVALRSE